MTAADRQWADALEIFNRRLMELNAIEVRMDSVIERMEKVTETLRDLDVVVTFRKDGKALA